MASPHWRRKSTGSAWQVAPCTSKGVLAYNFLKERENRQVMNNSHKNPLQGIHQPDLMHLAVKFNVSLQKVKAAVYTLGNDLRQIENWLAQRQQYIGAVTFDDQMGSSRRRSSV